MDYGMIGKIEKAKIYAEERNRFKFNAFTVRLAGDNDTVHVVNYDHGDWDCDCNFFASRGRCSHTMAVEHVLEDMFD